MIQNIKNISIPEPCSQSWDEMTPLTGGRHCANCCKTVTDFSEMTNQQIVDTLSNTGNICGRFTKHQLNSINFDLQEKKNFSWRRLGLAASLLFATACKTMGEPRLTGKIIKRDTTIKSTGKTVTQYKTHKPPRVQTKAPAIEKYKDDGGRHPINIPPHADTLAACYQSYKPLDVKPNDADVKPVDLQVNANASLTGLIGGVMVVGVKKEDERRPFYQSIYDMLRWL